MRHRLGIVGLVLLVGFALPVLTARAAEACRPIKLDFGQTNLTWLHLPLSKLKRDTVYTLTSDGGQRILHAEASSSVSLYATRFESPIPTPKTLSWRWRTDALVAGADNRDKKREDAPLRVLVAFDGDKTTLSEAEQKQMKRARMLSRREPPYATLMYLWGEQVPVDTVIPSAHTGQLKMIVAASGTSGFGAWQNIRRNVAEDYQRAFGKPPGPMIGVGVMTDTDNTGTKASGDYGDLRFGCGDE